MRASWPIGYLFILTAMITNYHTVLHKVSVKHGFYMRHCFTLETSAYKTEGPLQDNDWIFQGMERRGALLEYFHETAAAKTKAVVWVSAIYMYLIRMMCYFLAHTTLQSGDRSWRTCYCTQTVCLVCLSHWVSRPYLCKCGCRHCEIWFPTSLP